MREPLKAFAWICKIAAVVIWLPVSCITIRWDIHDLSAPSHWRESENWGTPAYVHSIHLEIAIIAMLALMSVLPNRWLVFSRFVFAVSLLVVVLIAICEFGRPPDWIISSLELLVFAPLLLSLILSFVRQRKGEKIGYI